MSNKGVGPLILAHELGIQLKVLREHVASGRIVLDEKGKVPYETYKMITEQRNENVSLREFLSEHTGERFDSSIAGHRYKFEWFLEENRYFGLSRHKAGEFLFCSSEEEDYYFSREEIRILDEKSKPFFDEFGLSIEERIQRAKANVRPNTLKYLKLYEKSVLSKPPKPSYAAFVEAVMGMPDVLKITNEDIIEALRQIGSVKQAKKYLVGFLGFVSSKDKTHYKKIEIKSNKGKCSKPAYSESEFLGLATFFFNSEYAKSNRLVEKALDTPLFAEMWLFHCLHFVCALRAGDICNKWVYPDFVLDGKTRGINLETLKEDLLYDRLEDAVLSEIAEYCVKRFNVSNYSASKTGQGHLLVNITPSLLPFFGKLVLIAEYHYMKTEEGHMEKGRYNYYNDRIRCGQFYGQEMGTFLGECNIESRRLNKSYLQSIEIAAHDITNSSLTAFVIAGFARSHSDLSSTLSYLNDGRLTGETAELTVFLMAERGALSFMKYNLISTVFEESFKKLPEIRKTEVMGIMDNVRPYRLEMLSYSELAKEAIRKSLIENKTVRAVRVMKEMVGIANGKGKAKDEGIYCQKLALGEECIAPSHSSCLANVCPYHIFTKVGVPSLVGVIRDFKKKAATNRKYDVLLKEDIIPAFREILMQILNDVNQEERKALLTYTKELMNG